ncbi:unnamed protein product [Coccothraustes coccothraustes]
MLPQGSSLPSTPVAPGPTTPASDCNSQHSLGHTPPGKTGTTPTMVPEALVSNMVVPMSVTVLENKLCLYPSSNKNTVLASSPSSSEEDLTFSGSSDFIDPWERIQTNVVKERN